MREAYPNELMHYGILGMRWGVRRYQKLDGRLTGAGRRRYKKDSKVIAKDEALQRQIGQRIYDEKERRLSIAREKADARQLATERRLENQRKRLENKRLKLENRDYEEAIKSGKSTKSYRDERAESLKSQNAKPQNNNQGNQNNQNNQNNNNPSSTSNPKIDHITKADLATLDYSNLTSKDIDDLVKRLSNEDKLNEMYQKSLPPNVPTKAINFVNKNGKSTVSAMNVAKEALQTGVAIATVVSGIADAIKKSKAAKKAAEAAT